MTLHTSAAAQSAADRFDRLPRWAQAELRARGERILALNRELAVARGLINTGPDDSEIIIDPYSANRRQVPNRPMVEFRYKPKQDVDRWRYFLVRLMDDDTLEIHASSSITLHPRSGNSVHVEVIGR
jgi:hypothetical protein